jgi:hypothetical protein
MHRRDGRAGAGGVAVAGGRQTSLIPGTGRIFPKTAKNAADICFAILNFFVEFS